MRIFVVSMITVLAIFSSTCGGSTATMTGPSPTPTPGPVSRPAGIKILEPVIPESGATITYVGPAGNQNPPATTPRIRVTYSLGTQTCNGEIWIVMWLSDRPGFFIWDSIDTYFPDGARQLRPTLKATVWDKQIRRTTQIGAYLVCKTDLRTPPGRPGQETVAYKSESDFADVIMAKDVVETIWNWSE